MRTYIVVTQAVAIRASAPRYAAAKVRRGQGDRLYTRPGSAAVVAASRVTPVDPADGPAVHPNQISIEDALSG